MECQVLHLRLKEIPAHHIVNYVHTAFYLAPPRREVATAVCVWVPESACEAKDDDRPIGRCEIGCGNLVHDVERRGIVE